MKAPVKYFPVRLLAIVALLLLSGITGELRSQNLIGFGSTGFSGMPDTAYSGDSIPVGAFVKNFSPQAYPVDTIQIRGYIDTGSVHIPFAFPPVVYSIPAYDSAFFILPTVFRDIHMGGNFRIGNNVIVVWPAVYHAGFSTGDSLTATVFVIDTISGIPPGGTVDESVRCFPVPSSGPLYIYSASTNYHPKEVMVHDASGQVVYYSKNAGASIDTEPWRPGIYFIEITFDNGAKHTYKIVRQ